MSGTSVSAARTMLETSKQVEALPATAAAMRAGKWSAAKAEAIASAAAVSPDAEAELLAGADAPLAVVRDKCLQAKAVDRDAAYARIRRDRHAREFTDKEGAWNFIARGTPDDGAKSRAALDPIVDEMFKTARAEDRREPRDAYAFDAFIELANRASGTGDGDGDGEDETPTSSGGPRRTARGSTSSTRSAPTNTRSRPATDGHSSPAPANDHSFRPTTRATRNTEHHPTHELADQFGVSAWSRLLPRRCSARRCRRSS